MKKIGTVFVFILILAGYGQSEVYVAPKLNHVLQTVNLKGLDFLNTDSAATLVEFAGLFRENRTGNGEWWIPVFIQFSGSAVLSEIRNLGGEVNSVTANIASCRLPLKNIRNFLDISGIKGVDAAIKLQPNNDIAIPYMNSPVARRSGYTGSHVICGVVDSGIDFTHPMFKNEDGTTRIKYLWDQTDNSGTPPSGFTYGTLYTEAQINADLAAGGNHSVVAETDGGSNEGHGTHVSGTFAGYDYTLTDTSFAGSATGANIVFVKTTFYGNTINDGVNFIFQKAQELNKPAVVNLSLGTQIGPHDGTDLYTEQLDQMTGAGKIIVRSAGNDGDYKIHVRRNNTSGSWTEPFTISGFLSEIIYFDGWYDGGDHLTVRVQGPGGLDRTVTYGNSYSSGSIVIDNASGGLDPYNNDNELYMQFSSTGSYTLTFTRTSDDGDGATLIDIWLRNGQVKQGSFTNATEATDDGSAYSGLHYGFTLGNGACGNNVIAVAAYMTRNSWTTNTPQSETDGDLGGIAFFSSHGPTRDGRLKPEVAAGGLAIISALSGDISTPTGYYGQDPNYPNYRYLAGTSMSSPAAAGAIALLMDRYPSYTPADVRQYIQNNSRGTTGNANTGPKTDPGVWDSGFGYGVFDATAIAKYHRVSLAIKGTGSYNFKSGTLTIADMEVNSENLDSIRVELFLDSIPPTAPAGSLPLPRFYDINPVGGTQSINTNMTLYYTQNEFDNSGITADESTLDLYRWSGSSWDPQFAAVNVDNNSLTANGVTQFSVWGISSTTDHSLPVELTEFSATAGNGAVNLVWTTASETNNAGFEIYRAVNENTGYSKIASYQDYPELAGQGSSSKAAHYRFTDRQVSMGQIYFYKLADVSYSGERRFSAPIQVQTSGKSITSFSGPVPETYELDLPYPNPFNPSVSVKFGVPRLDAIASGKVSLTVYDNLGRKIKQLFAGNLLPGYYEAEWNGTGETGNPVSSGVYFIVYHGSSGPIARKVMLIK